MNKNISKNVSGKYRQKLLEHVIQPVATASTRAIQKTAEATGDLIGNKTANKITKLSRTSPQNGLETNKVGNVEHDIEIPKELKKDIQFQKKRQKVIDDLTLR